jgi:hypothetical protein
MDSDKTDSLAPRILWGMARKLSDYSIDDLRTTLRATELSAGKDSQSAKIIRCELDHKLRQPAVDNGKRSAAEGGDR